MILNKFNTEVSFKPLLSTLSNNEKYLVYNYDVKL